MTAAPATVLADPRSQDRLAPAPGQEPASEKKVLVVDDSNLDRRLAGRMLEKTRKFKAIYATNGVEALKLLEEIAPVAVLTDMQMPEMNGLELVKQVRARHPQIPVVLMTAHGSEEVALQALRIGAASYVPKLTMTSASLTETLEEVLSVEKVDHSRQCVLASLTRRESHYRLESNPALIPALVTLLHEEISGLGLCDESGCIRVGIALREALLEALYRGNLEIDPKVRERDTAEYHQLAEQRRRTSPYQNRRVHVYASLVPAEAVYVIRHEGPGFDTSVRVEAKDLASLEGAGNRGRVLMRTFLDKATYSSGNQLTLVKRRESSRGISS